MTILETTNLLANHFKTNDTYSHEKDLKTFVIIDETGDKDLKRALIEETLTRLEKSDLVKKIEFPQSIEGNSPPKKKETYWVLVKPLSHYEQSIIICGDTGLRLANLINSFANTVNDSFNICNPLAISEGNLNYLLNIVNGMVEKVTQE